MRQVASSLWRCAIYLANHTDEIRYPVVTITFGAHLNRELENVEITATDARDGPPSSRRDTWWNYRMATRSPQSEGAVWFTAPEPVNHRRYEALRAYFVDGLTHAETGERFSYTRTPPTDLPTDTTVPWWGNRNLRYKIIWPLAPNQLRGNPR